MAKRKSALDELEDEELLDGDVGESDDATDDDLGVDDDDDSGEVVDGTSSPKNANARMCEFEKYEMTTLHRKECKNAPYNPRILTEKARAKLKKNISKIGLLGPITWNVRTGNIVSGHQRLSILDSLMKTGNYKIQVAKVDLSEQEEKAQNIFMNNDLAQGDFELDMLKKMFQDDKVNPEDAGYSLGEIMQMFGDSPLVNQADQLQELSDQIRANHDRIADIVANAVDNGDDGDFYSIIVWSSNADREQFVYTLGLPDERHIDGKQVWTALESIGVMELDASTMDGPDGLKMVPFLVEDCPQCGNDHEAIIRRMSKDFDGKGWWFVCSDTGDAVMLELTEEQRQRAVDEKKRVIKAYRDSLDAREEYKDERVKYNSGRNASDMEIEMPQRKDEEIDAAVDAVGDMFE